MKKIKIYSSIALILGLTLVLVSVLVPIIKISNYTAQNGSIGIIGGADGPTAKFLSYSIIWGGMLIYTSIFGITLTLASLFCLTFHKTVEKHCTLKTTVYSLAISFSGAAGLVCFLLWYSISCSHSIHIYVLHESNRMTVLSLNLAFSADHMTEDSADKRFKWIDPTQDILKHSPKFTTHACYTLPSQDEIEMQSREAAERFIKSFERFRFPFHKSDFPIKKIRIR